MYSLNSEGKVSTDKLLFNKQCVICALTGKKLQMSFAVFMYREGKKRNRTFVILAFPNFWLPDFVVLTAVKFQQ